MGNKILKVIHKETKLEIYRETLVYHFIVAAKNQLVIERVSPEKYIRYTLAEILLGNDFIVVLEQGGDLNKQSTET